jgi:hypothetical protein
MGVCATACASAFYITITQQPALFCAISPHTPLSSLTRSKERAEFYVVRIVVHGTEIKHGM